MSASRNRQKRKLEPISLEELAGATGMSGFCTFLTRDASIPVPVLDGAERGAPESSAPNIGAPDTAASDLNAPDQTAIKQTLPESTAPGPTALELAAIDSGYGSSPELIGGAPDSCLAEASALDSRYRRKPKIREAGAAVDGHSLAEEAVYEAMWREGKPYGGESRILTIGLRTLGEISRMAYSNCKANVRSLVAKLALDELPGFSYTDGRTYIIHGRDEILRRRRAAGLTHVLRTRGVAFVHPQTGAPVSGARVSTAPVSSAPVQSAEDL